MRRRKKKKITFAVYVYRLLERYPLLRYNRYPFERYRRYRYIVIITKQECSVFIKLILSPLE